MTRGVRSKPVAEGDFRVERNEHGAYRVWCGRVAIAAQYDRASARRLRDALARDPEAKDVAELAAALPEGTKVWHGAAGAVVASARGRDPTDYALACWLIWRKVRAVRTALGM